MAAFAGTGELVTRPSDDHLAAVSDEVLEKLLEVEQPRLIVDQRDHVHAEAVLQLCELEQVVEDNICDLAAPELDNHAHTRLVRFVAQIGDAVELLVANELADTREQRRLVHLIGNFVDDDGLAVAPLQILNVRARADHDAPATGTEAFAHALGAEDDARRREIRRRYKLD